MGGFDGFSEHELEQELEELLYDEDDFTKVCVPVTLQYVIYSTIHLPPSHTEDGDIAFIESNSS
jgi:hypothetical protein